MIRIFTTILAGTLGLAFGSFLNVCLTRWPAGESIARPRSHCRGCGRTLAWWENIPLASWIALKGRCGSCIQTIGWRYPLVEAAVAATWGLLAWQAAPGFEAQMILGREADAVFFLAIERFAGLMVLTWILIGLAVLDFEHFWLPDAVTVPSIVAGLFFHAAAVAQLELIREAEFWRGFGGALLERSLAAAGAAGMILIIRWGYWLLRRREGIGFGDVKLMAMLGAGLGFSGALVSFAVGVLLGAVAALSMLAIPSRTKHSPSWLAAKLPLGTFLCTGGIVSVLWGPQILHAYLRYAGL